MDFNLTEVQQDFMNLARDFGEKRLAPTIMERDHQGIYDDALIAELLSLGITALTLKKSTAVPAMTAATF